MRAVVVALLLGLAGCGEQAARTAPEPVESGRVQTADDDSFDRIVKGPDRPALVLFWAKWSGPDRIIMPYLGDAARARPGLTVVKVDVDAAPDTASRFEVLSVPTALLLEDGRVRAQVVGAQPQKEWERRLELDRVAPAGRP